MKLRIAYYRDTDTLWLGNDLPTPVGEDISENVTVFFDMQRTQANGVLIEHAAELLLPILEGSVQVSEEAGQPEKPAKAKS